MSCHCFWMNGQRAVTCDYCAREMQRRQAKRINNGCRQPAQAAIRGAMLVRKGDRG